MNLHNWVETLRDPLIKNISNSWGYDNFYEIINQEFVKLIQNRPHDNVWKLAINYYSINYFLDSIDSSMEELIDYFQQHLIVVEFGGGSVSFTFKYED